MNVHIDRVSTMKLCTEIDHMHYKHFSSSKPDSDYFSLHQKGQWIDLVQQVHVSFCIIL